jgi:nucleotide-binding universal stress UspA family protein
MIALKNILVATDFSEPSDAALAYGRELARRLGALVVVLLVV